MSQTVHTAAEERDQWRARILRALAELRAENRASNDDARGDEDDDDETVSSDAVA